MDPEKPILVSIGWEVEVRLDGESIGWEVEVQLDGK